MDNAADRKSIRAREKAAKVLASRRAAVMRNVMSTIEGRAWMWHLLSSCHIFASTFTADPLTTAFAEGQRNIGLALLAEIMTTCPDAYIQAQREANENDRHDSDDRNTDDSGSGSDPDERLSGAEPDGGDSGPGGDRPDEGRDPPGHPGLIDDAFIRDAAARRAEARRETN